MPRRLEFIQSLSGPLSVYSEPEHGRSYVIGVDSAEGKVRDAEKARRSSETVTGPRDYSAAAVVELESGRLAAMYHASLDTYKFSHAVYRLGIWFNSAMMAIEVGGNPGKAVQVNLLNWGYPNLFVPIKESRVQAKAEEEFGWKTTVLTRPLIIDACHQYLSSGETIPDEGLLLEIRNMEYDKTGKPRGIGKNKDDRVFAFGIALCARKETLEVGRPSDGEERYRDVPEGDLLLRMRVDELVKEHEEEFVESAVIWGDTDE